MLIDRPSEGTAKAGEMRAPVGIMNGVRVAEHEVVIAVVVLQHDFDVNFDGLIVEGAARFLDDANRFRMQRDFARVDLLNEFLDPVFVEISFLLWHGGAFVGEDNFQTGIQEG